MKKLLIAIIAMSYSMSAIAKDRVAGPIEADILSILDGDTIRVHANIWPGISAENSVRIRGIEAPELYQPHCPNEKEFALKAKDELARLLQGGTVILKNIEYDKYAGRVVADIFTKDGIDIGKYLLEHDLAKPWNNKGPKPNWC